MPPPTNPQPNWVKEEKHGDLFCAERKQMCKVICHRGKSRPICKLVALATAHWSGTVPIPNDVHPTQSQQFIWYGVGFMWRQTQDGCLCCSKTFLLVFCYCCSDWLLVYSSVPMKRTGYQTYSHWRISAAVPVHRICTWSAETVW